MKKYIILTALCGAWCSGVWGQTAYLSEIDITDCLVEKTEKREVTVSMKLDLSCLDMKRQHSLRLVPIVVSADGTQQQLLPEIIINGTVRDKIDSRIEALADTLLYPEAMTVVCRKNKTSQQIDYRTQMPFRRWMIGGEIQIEGYVTGCADCEEGYETASLNGEIFPPMHPSYEAGWMTPKEEIVKRRSETRSARLQFRRNSAVVEPCFSGNRAELDSVARSISLVKENDDLTITGIYVTGYSSPEGRFEYNMKLSERRARSFTEYIKDDLKEISPKLYHVEWRGEDWMGVRTEVLKHPQLLKREEVLDIIDHCGDDKDACEERLKALKPAEIYQRLLNEMYPVVRRNEYRVEYNVRHFDLEEGKKMIKTRPDLMSVSEIHKVAESYGKGTSAYADCLLAGAKTYPNEVEAVNNAALALIEAGRAEEAVALLQKIPSHAALFNVLGVACLKTGRMEAAETAFAKSASLGGMEGRKNLETLRAYTEYYAE